MPKQDYFCKSVIFNRNILISGNFHGNLLLYSIDTNAFSTIPYDFAPYKTKKEDFICLNASMDSFMKVKLKTTLFGAQFPRQHALLMFIKRFACISQEQYISGAIILKFTRSSSLAWKRKR
ncbi:unnamed protein product [Blepharisma stoltei]|uniref:Uncharacterized protein n=1 Tax=Blepharisma stoltei TaxID=1481888 RepID=A0AAU9KC11_9CILI|nr:unnamed protein product [Blepharisma stoltei]